jgi:hypothetical protein
VRRTVADAQQAPLLCLATPSSPLDLLGPPGQVRGVRLPDS